ncbi:MAG: sensor histidine kinase, partial [Candidatus Dadabacteria bacterium]
GAADGHDVLVATDITPRRELERQQELTVAMLTHDLKTPLTALGGVLSLLEDTETSTSAERHRLYDAGTRNVQRMLALIGDMLELHQLRRGHAQIHLQPIRPRELVQEVVRGLAPAADEAGVSLTCGRLDEGTIVADPQRLQQVVENLCSNALRYAGKGATATVDVVATADALQIAVSDNGPGIPEAIQPILFKPFQIRSVGHKPHPNSTGLGLATAKLLVEQMGGTLRLAHTGPDGTRFSITFPRA